MRRLRLALAQMNSTVGDLSGNAAKIRLLIGEARKAGADLVALTPRADREGSRALARHERCRRARSGPSSRHPRLFRLPEPRGGCLSGKRARLSDRDAPN